MERKKVFLAIPGHKYKFIDNWLWRALKWDLYMRGMDVLNFWPCRHLSPVIHEDIQRLARDLDMLSRCQVLYLSRGWNQDRRCVELWGLPGNMA